MQTEHQKCLDYKSFTLSYCLNKILQKLLLFKTQMFSDLTNYLQNNLLEAHFSVCVSVCLPLTWQSGSHTDVLLTQLKSRPTGISFYMTYIKMQAYFLILDQYKVRVMFYLLPAMDPSHFLQEFYKHYNFIILKSNLFKLNYV